MSDKPKGTLIIIGGHEQKAGHTAILERVAEKAGDKGRLVVVTVATSRPEEVAAEYREAFRKLGLKHVDVLDVRSREEAYAEENVAKIRNASVVFFTGGDQLRITSQVGDSGVFRCMQEIYRGGATIAGTSAGAAAMPETMLVSGSGDSSHSMASLTMAPGLALISGVAIDSHFAERGRMGRLLATVAHNPRNLGLGIDEDTAIVVTGDEEFEVVGSGAVYVVDGTEVTYTSVSDQATDEIIRIDDVKLHVLAAHDRFSLITRRPIRDLEQATAGK